MKADQRNTRQTFTSVVVTTRSQTFGGWAEESTLVWASINSALKLRASHMVKKGFSKKEHFLSFLHLKFHSSHQKHTSQKWCLEVSTTFFKEVRAKKRLSVVWSVKNDVFQAKINQFCWKFKDFLEIQGCHTWWFWMKTDDYYMLWFLRFSSPKTCFFFKKYCFLHW